jgi:hypothetical protein
LTFLANGASFRALYPIGAMWKIRFLGFGFFVILTLSNFKDCQTREAVKVAESGRLGFG